MRSVISRVWWGCRRAAALNGDGDYSLSVSLAEVADGLGGLVQRVRPVDDRRDLPGFQELGQGEQVILVPRQPDRPNPLGSQERQHRGALMRMTPVLAIQRLWNCPPLGTSVPLPRLVSVAAAYSVKVSLARAEDLIPDPEPCHGRSDRRDGPRDIRTAHTVARPAQPGGDARDVRHPGDTGPVGRVHSGRADLHEHLVVLDYRRVDVPKFQDVGRAVGVLDDRFHCVCPSWPCMGFQVVEHHSRRCP